MNIYGYKKDDTEHLLELEQASISATPAELRNLAGFFNLCAEQMEANKSGNWDHEHLEDSDFHLGEDSASLVVASPRNND